MSLENEVEQHGVAVGEGSEHNPPRRDGTLSSGHSQRDPDPLCGRNRTVDGPPQANNPVVPEQVPLGDPRRAGVPINCPVFVEPEHFLLTVQPFTGGGYEATVKLVDAQKIAERRCLFQERRRRTRKEREEQDGRNVLRARKRAKKKVRHLCKEMGADRILTLTTREQSNTPEQMLDRWQRWLRLVERAAGGRFHYVGVLEPHPSNPAHLHMHVAVAVFLNVNVLRQCWWTVCGGRAMGNVHIKRLKAQGGIRRVYKVASYISKYITKETAVEFNRKRYWASRVRLPDVRRYWLRARTLEAACGEAWRLLNYWNFDGKGTFACDEAKVLWFECEPGRIAYRWLEPEECIL